jgi:hypothetical protein
MVPDYERPVAPTPAAWPAAAAVSPSAQPISAGWWQRFGSHELDGLMTEAMTASKTCGGRPHRSGAGQCASPARTCPPSRVRLRLNRYSVTRSRSGLSYQA